MNRVITKYVKYRGHLLSVQELKPNSNIKIEVECKHGRRMVKWCRRHQQCRKCRAEAGIYNTSPKGRNITWGDKISKAKRGKKFSEAHKVALSKAQYRCDDIDWPGFYRKCEIQQIRDSIDYVDFRKQVFQRDKYCCVITGRQGYLALHHLESMNNNLEKAMHLDNVVTLHHTVHSKFHLLYGNGNNTAAQFQQFKENFLVHPKTLILLCGQSGSGKTTIARQLINKFTVFHYDKNKKLETEVGQSTADFILIDLPMLISTYYKKFHNLYNVHVVCILEPENVIEQRLKARDGKITGSIHSRYKRLQSLTKRYADFKGSADEVFTYLKAL